MDRDFDMEKVIDKMRELKDKRDLELLKSQLDDINIDTDYKKKLYENKVVNVKYLGSIDWKEEIEGNIIESEKGIYLIIEQKEEKDGKKIQIDRYYTEDGELLGGNNKSDNYDYVILNEKYQDKVELQEKLQELDKDGILDLNEIDKERLEEIATSLGIDSKDIGRISELDVEEIEKAEEKLDEYDEEKSQDENSNNDTTLTEEEYEKIPSKTEINMEQKITNNETMASLLGAQDKGYQKIEVVYSDKLQGNGDTTKFSFVGIKNERVKDEKTGKYKTVKRAEKIDNLEQVGGIHPNKKVYSLNNDGSKIEEQQMNSIYRIKGKGGDDKQVAVKIGQMGKIETSLLRSPKYNNQEAIAAPIQNSKDITPTTREVRTLMTQEKNPDIKAEIDRTKEHEKEGCEPNIKDIDDNPYNNTHEHSETIDKAYIDACVKEILSNDTVASNYGRDYVQGKVMNKIENSEYLSKDEIVEDLTKKLVEDSEYEHTEIEHEHDRK